MFLSRCYVIHWTPTPFSPQFSQSYCDCYLCNYAINFCLLCFRPRNTEQYKNCLCYHSFFRPFLSSSFFSTFCYFGPLGYHLPCACFIFFYVWSQRSPKWHLTPFLSLAAISIPNKTVLYKKVLCTAYVWVGL